MSIPKDVLPMIRRVAFSRKADVRDSMKPQDNKLMPEIDTALEQP
jgi:hypothetical protein